MLRFFHQVRAFVAGAMIPVMATSVLPLTCRAAVEEPVVVADSRIDFQEPSTQLVVAGILAEQGAEEPTAFVLTMPADSLEELIATLAQSRGANPIAVSSVVGPPIDPEGKPLPPLVLLPPGKDGQPNEWVPVPGSGSRPVKWIPNSR